MKEGKIPSYQAQDSDQFLDVLVVGAGFGGLWQLHKLRELGYKVKVAERGSDLGGVWYWNRYPGARTDSSTPIYEFSWEKIWRGWTWTQRYPDHVELRRYFQCVEDNMGLKKDIYFNCDITAATWDNDSTRWVVETSAGMVFKARFFVLCVGSTTKQYVPEFQGLDEYKGKWCHSARWPNELSLSGKNVAVVGTGSTGIQLVQELAPKVAHLTVYQRSPNLCLPMQQMELTTTRQMEPKSAYPELFRKRITTFSGLEIEAEPRNAIDDTPEERNALYERVWERGGFYFWVGTYQDIFFNLESNRTAYNFWRDKTRPRIKDERMRDILAPMEPVYPFGTKRPSLEQNYYETFNRSNVSLIDVSSTTKGGTPIDRFTENGIRLKDGTNRDHDFVVLATGFDSVTGAILDIDIKGVQGVSLRKRWKSGTRTYLGMTTADFPNMFWLYGPHGPTALSNGPSSTESQGDWIIDTIDRVVKWTSEDTISRKGILNPTNEAQEQWSKYVRQLSDMSLLPMAKSWYNGANIPGKPVEPLNYTGGVGKYMSEVNDAKEDGFRGFTLS